MTDTTPAAVERMALIFETYDGDVADLLRALSDQLEAAMGIVDKQASLINRQATPTLAADLIVARVLLAEVFADHGKVNSLAWTDAVAEILAMIPADTPAKVTVQEAHDVLADRIETHERNLNNGFPITSEICMDMQQAVATLRAIAGGRDE